MSVVATTGSAFAAADAVCPHHNNDEGHSCRHHGKHRHEGSYSEADMQRFRERMDKLALSDAQKQDMASLMRIYQPRFKALRERGAADREALFAAAPDATGYAALTDAVSIEAGRTAAEVVVLMAELQANAYALLTPDQQAEYRAMKVKAWEKAQEKARQRKEQMSEKRGDKP